MSTKRTCPSCHVALKVPAGARGSALTCPRCLARVGEPAAAGPAPGRDGSADAEVWWDTRAAGFGLIALAVLGVLGLAFFAVAAVPFPRTGGEWALVVVTGVLFLAVLAAAAVELRKPEDPAARGAGRLRAPAREKGGRS